MNPEVDAYIERSEKWPEEMTGLRPILLAGGLTEELKWGKPCYTHEGKNIVILQEMNDFLALMFFKGALLTDPDGVLESQGPNSRSARRVCVSSVEDVGRLSDTVRPSSRRRSGSRRRASRSARRPSSCPSRSFSDASTTTRRSRLPSMR